MIPIISSDEDLSKIINNNPNLVVMYFYTKWCGPCKIIGPSIERMSEEYFNRVQFLKIDAQDCMDATDYFGIKSVPSFVVLKNDLILSNIQSTDIDVLRLAIDQNMV